MGRWHNLDGGSCCGQRPGSGEGLAWPAPPSRPLHPPTFSRTGGHPLYPRRGLRPLHPAWGMEGAAFSPSAGYGGRDKMRLLDGWSCCGQRCPSREGSVWPAPLSRPHRPPTFSSTGGLPLYPRRGCAPCTPFGRGGRDRCEARYSATNTGHSAGVAQSSAGTARS